MKYLFRVLAVVQIAAALPVICFNMGWNGLGSVEQVNGDQFFVLYQTVTLPLVGYSTALMLMGTFTFILGKYVTRSK